MSLFRALFLSPGVARRARSQRAGGSGESVAFFVFGPLPSFFLPSRPACLSPCPSSLANQRREEPTPIPTTSTLAGVAILTPSSDGSLVAVTLCEACLKAAPLRSYAHPPPQPASPCDSFTHPITNSPTMPASCPHPKFKPVLQIARDANLPRALPRVPCRPLPTVSSLPHGVVVVGRCLRRRQAVYGHPVLAQKMLETRRFLLLLHSDASDTCPSFAWKSPLYRFPLCSLLSRSSTSQCVAVALQVTPPPRPDPNIIWPVTRLAGTLSRA